MQTSDHSAFAFAGIPAVMLSGDHCAPNDCNIGEGDFDAYNITIEDTAHQINVPYSFAIAKEAVAAV
ncbi:MAG: hypothetical protein JXR76_31670 [Deltaproteobacteria bacterium]|nr:hypothetical protein [Deltaproteobacteria bacterium]